MSVVPTGHPDPDRRKALQLYGLFGATLILLLIPHVSAALVSMIMITVLLFASGMARKKSRDDSIAHNHAIYIFRTVWIGSFFALVTVILSSLYLVEQMDNSPLQSCSENLVNQIDPSMSATALYPLLKPCMDEFIKVNFQVLMIASLIAAAPPYLYMLARFIRGFSRANGGYRIAKPKAWF